MRKHLIDKLVQKAAYDDRIVLMVADLGFNVVDNFQKKYSSRFINCGIAEGNMLSVATGMALEGDIVFVYSIGNFPTLRCLEQIRNGACYHNVDVKIISVGGGFSYGSLGMTHHATEDLAIMRSLPNMRVYAPADPCEAEAVLDDMIDYSGPCYVRLARGQDEKLHMRPVARNIRYLLPYRSYSNEKWDVTIVSTGTILSDAIKVEEKLEKIGIATRLYSCPTIKPIDVETIRAIALKSNFLVTMEEHNIIGGLGGVCSEVVSGMDSHARLLRFGLQDSFANIIGSGEFLRKYYGMDCESVYKQVVQLVRGK